jgi:hypothetical protein
VTTVGRKIKDPDPGLLAELYEALDSLEATSRELRRKKRELFPAIRARQRATARVLEVWKAMRGRKAGPPAQPLLDAIAAKRPAAAPAAERARREAEKEPALRKVRRSGKAALAELEAVATAVEFRPDGRPEDRP